MEKDIPEKTNLLLSAGFVTVQCFRYFALPGSISSFSAAPNMHHLHPTAPWKRLPALVAEDGRAPDMGYLRAALRQLRGPVPLSALPPYREAGPSTLL